MTVESLAKLAVNVRNMRNVLVKFGQGVFYARQYANQTIPTGAGQTVLTVGTEDIDLNSWFASNVYTPKQPGYYLFFGTCQLTLDADFTDTTHLFQHSIRKNGSNISTVVFRIRGNTATNIALAEANGSTDYFDCAATHSAGADVTINYVSFGGLFVSYNNP